MSVLDRQQAPAFNTIEHINIPPHKTFMLANGVHVHYINNGVQDVIRIELCFEHSYTAETQQLQAEAAYKLINSGTTTKTSKEIDEALDYYGSYFEISTGREHSYLTLYALNKHLESVLPVLTDVLQNNIYPENELAIYTQNAIQKLRVNDKKVNQRAAKKFAQVLYGENNPLGYTESEEAYANLNPDVLLNFYNQHIKQGAVSIIVSGSVEASQLSALNGALGGLSLTNATFSNQNSTIHSSTEKIHRVDMPDSVQCALRVGRVMVTKNHPDYMGLKILNTILGGYFGSRLMSNIREDKGYTYGIGSFIMPRNTHGYFGIGTEVGADVYKQALEEIYKEIQLLIDEPVGVDELDLVRNYKLGNLLKGFDGPFAQADKLRSLINYGLDYEYYHTYINKIKTITPTELQALAKQYLQPADMFEVVAGKI